MTVPLTDYHPSRPVTVLLRLAVGAIMRREEDISVGISACVIALIDDETGRSHSQHEIGRLASRLSQEYVREWMHDPW